MSQEPSQSRFSEADITTVEDAEAEINALESLIAGLDTDNDYDRALLRNQVLRLRLLVQQQRGALPETIGQGGQKRRLLPQGAVGIANRDIYENDNGPATFQINGTVFSTTVQATEDIDSSAIVEVVGNENQVKESDGSAFGILTGGSGETFVYDGEFRTVPSVVDPEIDIKVQNQVYEDEEYTTVADDLGPGQKKTFAQITVESDEFLLLKYTNATAANTVRYNYYIDGEENPDPDLSGSTPLTTPPDKYEVVPDGYMIVENEVRLDLRETSGNTQYDGLSALLTGLKLEV